MGFSRMAANMTTRYRKFAFRIGFSIKDVALFGDCEVNAEWAVVFSNCGADSIDRCSRIRLTTQRVSGAKTNAI